MPINDYRVTPISTTDRTKRFHRDEKTKKLIKEDRYNKSSSTYNGKSFSEILNEEIAKKK